MKNQNDMIWSIVSIVVALIVAGVCFGTARPVVPPAAAPQVNTAPPQYPATQVVMANSLPSGGSGGAGRGLAAPGDGHTAGAIPGGDVGPGGGGPAPGMLSR